MKTLKEIAEMYGFTLTDKTSGISWLIECSYYLTNYPNTYITDYNNEENILYEKQLVMLFYKGENIILYQKVHLLVALADNVFPEIVTNFYKTAMRKEAEYK